MLRHYLESVTESRFRLLILYCSSLAKERASGGISAQNTPTPDVIASNGALQSLGLNDGASFDKAVVLLRNPLHAIYSYFHFTMASRVQHIDRRRALHNYSLTDEELARFAGAAPGAAWWTGPGWLHFVERWSQMYATFLEFWRHVPARLEKWDVRLARYEDLVDRPRAVLKDVTHFILWIQKI